MADVTMLDDLDIAGKTVLVRVDFNVPMKDGKVTDATRIQRGARTIRELMDKGARVVLLSHFGRPKGQRVPEMSLRPIVEPLRAALGGAEVAFAEDCIGPAAEQVVAGLQPGQVALLENLRFHAEEEKGDEAFAAKLAALGDVYVNDAFSAAHRAHASVSALARLLPSAAGRLMQEELEHLEQALENPARPLMAVVGGAKVSTKLDLLANLVAKVDVLVIGGGMANTFLHAVGQEVGASLCERDMADTARDIMRRAQESGCDVVLPTDVVVAGKLAEGVETKTVSVKEVPGDMMILDLGPASAEHLARRLEDCRALVWNGPLGAFETPPFDAATNHVARKAAEMTASGRLLSVAGGGDTVAALTNAGVLESFSYVSSAGGAFLEWLEGKELPGVAALRAG
ncbi:phosphoglycerate kinase [Ferruginivarius sediminum]|uniref:Phosphoglycerate kinase n=1 Tax=Ferruginivarius sediminum TaxID=2661937 RepID=A0A369T744_9PROT|nr:phosphoglycerate kinase [Ferruginivarius sediminum]RDD61151.1 phosphoglycerate kinase [Ferruginivarius sediminum]